MIREVDLLLSEMSIEDLCILLRDISRDLLAFTISHADNMDEEFFTEFRDAILVIEKITEILQRKNAKL